MRGGGRLKMQNSWRLIHGRFAFIQSTAKSTTARCDISLAVP
jgi:hypothetical protein